MRFFLFVPLLFLFFLAPLLAFAVPVTIEGTWKVECNITQTNNYNSFDKAIETVLNEEIAKVFISRGFNLEASPRATGIELTWDIPTEREDGSQIEKIDRFNIYVYFNDVLQNTIEVASDAVSYELLALAAGNYSFQISTVEDGQEGKPSPKIYQVIE